MLVHIHPYAICLKEKKNKNARKPENEKMTNREQTKHHHNQPIQIKQF